MSVTAPTQFLRELRKRVGRRRVLSSAADLVAYECDGFTIEKNMPDAVAFPESARQVAEVVKLANEYEVPVVARGAGTSLAGGCSPIGGGVVVMLTRMKKIVRIDLRNRMAVVEAGVPNIQLTRAIGGTVEEAFHFGFPLDAKAIVVIELDGPSAGLDRQQEEIVKICSARKAREVLQAASPAERDLLWKCRKLSVGAVGRLSSSYCIQDGVVPRTRLPHILRRIAEIGAKHDIRIVNVAHAGDGNVHPILLFDERDKDQMARVLAAGRDLLEECIECGGSVTAEHGIGVEKIDFMARQFSRNDLDAMGRIKAAFNPSGHLGPGKLLPCDGVEAVVQTAPARRGLQ